MIYQLLFTLKQLELSMINGYQCTEHINFIDNCLVGYDRVNLIKTKDTL